MRYYFYVYVHSTDSDVLLYLDTILNEVGLMDCASKLTDQCIYTKKV